MATSALQSSTFSRFLSSPLAVNPRSPILFRSSGMWDLEPKFRTFLRWMRDNGIEYTDGLAFDLGGSCSVADIGVRAVYPLQTDDLIATIPKQACLTVKTTAAAKLIDDEEIGGVLGLAVALMYERSLQEQSRWYGYLQLLPTEQNLPFIWTPMEIDSLLLGTELHKAIKEDRIIVEENWKEYIAPLSCRHANKFPAKWFTLDHYLAAKTLVDSRAFEVDDYHGYGMVPLADLFNHKTADEDMHFTSVLADSDSESDAKESLEVSQGKNPEKSRRSNKNVKSERHESECLHEAEVSSDVSSSCGGNSELLELMLVKDVAEGSEIFNTYGTLSNAALLLRYGFTEPGNPFDIVNIDLTLVLDSCSKSFSSRHIRRRTAQWRKVGGAPCLSQDGEYFEISADGKPQEDLLMYLLLMHLSDEVFDTIFNSKALSGQGIEATARALGWEGPPDAGSEAHGSKRTTQRGEMAETKVKKSKVELECWLLTAPVCKSLLDVLQRRDSLYSTSCLEDDLALLSATICHEQPKQFYALTLRASERSILKLCETFVSQRLTLLMNES